MQGASSYSVEGFNEIGTFAYIGFNVVNQKPVNPFNGTQLSGWKTPDDWKTAFALLSQNLPHINAVRMYSTTEGSASDSSTTHLMNAMSAAKNYNLTILAGVWSGSEERFETERQTLSDAIARHGCGVISAISVGNEDLNDINKQNGMDEYKDILKMHVADVLTQRISQIRDLVRCLGCHRLPVTHTDTWNDIPTQASPGYRM